MSDQEVYPLAVLFDELKHDEVAPRYAAMEKLPTVALALGEERSRTELIPFLNDVAKEDEDEILALLANILGDFVQYIGGPNYAELLLHPLSTLAMNEEPMVRDGAVNSLVKIAKEMPISHLSQHFIPLVADLAHSEWFSCRIAAAGLYPITFEALSHAQIYDATKDLLDSFNTLITDDAPMVRRAAGNNLPGVIAALPHKADVALVLPMFQSLSEDSQDSVKLLSIESAVVIAKTDPENMVPQIVSRVYDLLEDKSWRVRYQAADTFAALANSIALNEEVAKTSHDKLLDLFVNLANDPEAEVRTAIAKQVVDYANGQLTKEDIIDRVTPSLENLTTDSSESVREALAGKIARLSPKIGKDATIKYLLPLFLEMLRDENSEVRLQIISNLDVINEIFGIERLSESLLPAIADLAKDKQWRVLLAVIDYSPLLAKQLGVDYFNKEIVPLVLNWLWDPVWAIRDAAAENLNTLADVFGVEWLEQEIVPKLVMLEANTTYLYRLTALLAVKKIAAKLSPDNLISVILPFVLEMSTDPVPNIRFNCATTIAIVANRIASEKPDLVKREILPLLERLNEDSDVDVRFFASKAVKSVQESSPQLFA